MKGKLKVKSNFNDFICCAAFLARSIVVGWKLKPIKIPDFLSILFLSFSALWSCASFALSCVDTQYQIDSVLVDRIGVLQQTGSLTILHNAIDKIQIDSHHCSVNLPPFTDELKVKELGSDLEIISDLDDATTDFIDIVLTLPEVAYELVVIDGTGNVLTTDLLGSLEFRTIGTGDVSISGNKGGIVVGSNGTGNLSIVNASSSVTIGVNGTGRINLENISGNVQIGSTGTGDVEITGVAGSVEIGNAGTANISINEVTVDVEVKSSGTGSISAVKIGGNLIVGSKSIGQITYRNVDGEQYIPCNELLLSIDADPLDASIGCDGPPSISEATLALVNVATRGFVGVGDEVLIAGFVIEGTGKKKLVVRAKGPSLQAAGVLSALVDPQITVFSGALPIDSNDNWQSHDRAGDIPHNLQPTDEVESAIYLELLPGAYTAIVSGVNGGTGIGIVEVFEIR